MKNRLVWTAVLVFLAGLWFLSGEVLFLYLAGVFVLSLVLSLPVRPGREALHPEISMDSTAAEGRSLEMTVTLSNTGFRPVLRGRLCLEAVNLLTGERLNRESGFSLGSRGRTRLSYELTPEHCGKVRIRVKQVTVGDIWGLFPKKEQAVAESSALVAPEIFPVTLGQERVYSYDCESDEYSPLRSGTDPSETFGIREYQPGDSLKSIHWKLTEKFGETMVRLPGYPVSNSLALMVDTGFREDQHPEPEVLDALMGAAVSVGQKLAEEGIAFRLVLPSSREPRIFTVENEVDFSSLLPELLGCRGHVNPEGLPGRYLESRGELPFAKTLWFTSTPDERMEEWRELTKLSVLCCTKEQRGSEEGLLFFLPEEAREALHYLEL